MSASEGEAHVVRRRFVNITHQLEGCWLSVNFHILAKSCDLRENFQMKIIGQKIERCKLLAIWLKAVGQV